MLGLLKNNSAMLPVVNYWKLCDCMWIVLHLQMYFVFCFSLLTLSSTSILIHFNRCFPTKRQTGHMVVFNCFKWEEKKVNLHISQPLAMTDCSEHGDDIRFLLEDGVFPTLNHRNTLTVIRVFRFHLRFECPVLLSYQKCAPLGPSLCSITWAFSSAS